jgi:hypothetical protein
VLSAHAKAHSRKAAHSLPIGHAFFALSHLLSAQLAQPSAEGAAFGSPASLGPESSPASALASVSVDASATSHGAGVVGLSLAQLEAQSLAQLPAHVRASLHIVNARYDPAGLEPPSTRALHTQLDAFAPPARQSRASRQLSSVRQRAHAAVHWSATHAPHMLPPASVGTKVPPSAAPLFVVGSSEQPAPPSTDAITGARAPSAANPNG